jgi:hypothetical protein
MLSVQMNEQEWQQIIQILATAPWNVANPLLMKVGEQLRKQQTNSGNMQEMPIPPAQVAGNKAAN